MTNFLCLIGSHKFFPNKVFYTSIVDDNKNHLYYDSNYTGHQCVKCGQRKLVSKYQYTQTGSIGERQDAYDWLNDIKKPKKAEILRLIK